MALQEIGVNSPSMPEQASREGIALSVRDLTKSYDGVEVLHGVSLDIPRNKLTLIEGESGSGKSTLLKCISGLDDITSGEVAVGSQRLDEYEMGEKLTDLRGEKFGFVFQSPNLINGLSIAENIRLPHEVEGKELDEEWLESIYKILGLTEKLNVKPSPRSVRMEWLSKYIKSPVGEHRAKPAYPPMLSGGEKQRVAIARAIAHKPEILFADEPTSALDTDNKVKIHELFSALVDHGSTIVMVSHDAISKKYADHTIRLQDGLVVS